MQAVARPPSMPDFVFSHAGSHRVLAWPRYKLKECWTLVLCLLQLRTCEGTVIVHNWRGGNAFRFTSDFRKRRAARVDPDLARAPIIDAHAIGGPIRLLALCLAAFTALLPTRGILFLVRAVMPRRIDTLVVFCDGHLSGFALVLAGQCHGASTLSLQHGLYRNDDAGSIMGIRNFVADRICLWDARTYRTFLDAGVCANRLLQVGEYGFAALSSACERQTDLMLLCPPYDVRQIATFVQLADVLPKHLRVVWSLHPMLRKTFRLSQVAVATTSPRPALAICGDSGALMDALARHIPIVTISDRKLATSHMTLKEASTADGGRLAMLCEQASRSLREDRRLFGFDNGPDLAGGTS